MPLLNKATTEASFQTEGKTPDVEHREAWDQKPVSSTKGSQKIANKPSQRYSDIISFMRRHLRFDLLKTCLISLRGFRGKKLTVVDSPVDDIDLNIII